MENEKEPNINCKECFGNGNILIYFADHKKRIVIEEWIYCKTCYPDSDCCGLDHSTHYADEVSREEAELLIEKENYSEYVP